MSYTKNKKSMCLSKGQHDNRSFCVAMSRLKNKFIFNRRTVIFNFKLYPQGPYSTPRRWRGFRFAMSLLKIGLFLTAEQPSLYHKY
jgi:hypothetical protein